MPLWFGLSLIVRTTMAGDLRNTHIYDVYISYMMVKQVIILINQRMKYVRWLQKYIGVHNTLHSVCGIESFHRGVVKKITAEHIFCVII